MNNWDRFGIVFLTGMIVMIAVGLSQISTNTEDVLQWLPDQSAAREDYNFFRQHFDTDDFIILTWDGCTTDDSRLTALAEAIKEQTGWQDSNVSNRLIERVTTGRDITAELGKRLGISRLAVMKRLRGVFFGVADIEQTCVLAELSQAGAAQRAVVVDAVFEAIDATDGLSREQVSLAGYPYIGTYIGQQLRGSYHRLLLPSIVLATVISLLCLRNWTLGAIVFVTAVGSATASVAFTPLCGYRLGGMMSIIPALVFVLATSGSIHLIRYSLDCDDDPSQLLKIGWKPCLISTFTTAVGMLSLLRSDFPAIRNFGLFCATGVCIALAFQLTLVPWLLWRFGGRGLQTLRNRRHNGRFWQGLAETVRQRPFAITVLFMGILAAGVAGLFRLQAQVEVEKLFRPNSSIIRSLTQLERSLGPMDQAELLVVFDDVNAGPAYRRVDFVRELKQEILKSDQVQVAYSLDNFLPRPPKRRSARNVLRQSAYRQYIDRNLTDLANDSLLAIDPATGREIWRISIRFPFIQQVDFDSVRETILGIAENVIQRRSEPPAKTNPPANADPETASISNENADRLSALPADIVFTGQVYLFSHAQVTLLQDLVRNFVLAFVIITPVLVIVLRSVKIGLLAMLPNIFPTVAVFGLLGWTGYPIDMALAMTACVALGIAVDDTTHFLIRFREFGGRENSLDGPISKTIAQCGPAMWHTTLIASASLLTFYFSEMLVVSRFSWAISSLLAVALLADVLMLPALLWVLMKKRQAPKS